MDLFKRRKATPSGNPITDVEVFEQEYPTLLVALESEVSIGTQDVKVTTFTFGARKLAVYTVAGAVHYITDTERPLQLPFALYWLSDEALTGVELEKLQEGASDNADWYYTVALELAPQLTDEFKRIYHAHTTENALTLLELFPTGPTTVRTELLTGELASVFEENFTFFSYSPAATVRLAEAVQHTIASVSEEVGIGTPEIITLQLKEESYTPHTAEESFLLEASRSESTLAAARALASGFLWSDVLTTLATLARAEVLALEGAVPRPVEALPDLTVLQVPASEPSPAPVLEDLPLPTTPADQPFASSDEEVKLPPLEAPSEEPSEEFLSLDDIFAEVRTAEAGHASKPAPTALIAAEGDGWGFQEIAPEDATESEAFESGSTSDDDGEFLYEEEAAIDPPQGTAGLTVALDEPIKRLLHSNFMTEDAEHRILQLQRQNEKLEQRVSTLEAEELFTVQVAYLTADEPALTAEPVGTLEEKRFTLNQLRLEIFAQLASSLDGLHGDAVGEVEAALAAKVQGLRAVTNLVFIDPTPVEVVSEAVEEEPSIFALPDASAAASEELLADLDALEDEEEPEAVKDSEEATGEASTRDLVKDALQANPEAIVVGPVSEEAEYSAPLEQEETPKVASSVTPTLSAELLTPVVSAPVEAPSAEEEEVAEAPEASEAVAIDEGEELTGSELLEHFAAQTPEEPATGDAIIELLAQDAAETPVYEFEVTEAVIAEEEAGAIDEEVTPEEDEAPVDIPFTAASADFDPRETPIFAQLIASRSFDPFAA